ncbi:IclR family transcriptional regulator [Thauera sp. Sel9]|uniref:IclR family transcriptional regulator n=1 Tax=Thauera sp. Sel9 TaxID=2974299 RepID=UPI0021E11DCB|nr:IclR family transcriptional regulator [Thauera sp. Sel9]MCV2216297.1 IclR family transcriptional regulator [Thauera sp. Sel9]
MPRKPSSPPPTLFDPAAGAEEKRSKSGDPRSSPLFVNSVEKAFQILAVFGPSRRQLTLTQIVAQSGMDMSSVQRFTHTLVTLNLLRKDPRSKSYELSPGILRMAHQYISSNDLVSRAMPYLQHLAMETEAAVNLTILDGTDIVYLQRIVSRYVLSPEIIMGTRLPAYCTSSGLAMLAALPRHEAEAILDRSQLIKYTRHTVNDREQILARLDTIRDLGYSHVEDEMYLGDIALGVAITDSSNKVVGAINIGIARPQWKGEEDKENMLSLLIAAGRAISSRG